MLALAMTLVQEPQVLLIDELSLGLAPVVVEELLGVVEQMKADGTTMVIVEQSLNIALAIADRVVFMEAGRLVEEAGTDIFFTQPQQERTREFLRQIL